MTMNRITINKVAAILGILFLGSIIFSLLDFSFNNFIFTYDTAIKVNHAITVSESYPFFINSAWAMSLNKTAGSSSISSSYTIDNISVDVTSQHIIHGIAGQFVKVNGTITNNNPNDTTQKRHSLYIDS